MANDARGTLRPALEHLPEVADVLLIAGDLTQLGTEREVAVLIGELAGISLPCVAVLGNHDYHGGAAEQLAKLLEHAGVDVLEGTSVVIEVGEETVGIAGTKGFGGGFAGACGSDFGEPEMKSFVHLTRDLADGLHDALATLRTDVRVALTHFAPVKDTLGGERLEIYPFLGSYLLGGHRPRQRRSGRARPRTQRRREGRQARRNSRTERGTAGHPGRVSPLSRLTSSGSDRGHMNARRRTWSASSLACSQTSSGVPAK